MVLVSWSWQKNWKHPKPRNSRRWWCVLEAIVLEASTFRGCLKPRHCSGSACRHGVARTAALWTERMALQICWRIICRVQGPKPSRVIQNHPKPRVPCSAWSNSPCQKSTSFLAPPRPVRLEAALVHLHDQLHGQGPSQLLELGKHPDHPAGHGK